MTKAKRPLGEATEHHAVGPLKKTPRLRYTSAQCERLVALSVVKEENRVRLEREERESALRLQAMEVAERELRLEGERRARRSDEDAQVLTLRRALCDASTEAEALGHEDALVALLLRFGHYQRKADATRVARSVRRKRARTAPDEGVYRIADRPDPPHKVYVGHSKDIEARIAQHARGEGNAFAKGFQYRLKLLSHETRGKGREALETLTNMLALGIANVRGAHHSTPVLTHDQKRAAFREICHEFDRCFRCGKPGHTSSSPCAPMTTFDAGFL